MRSEFQKIDLRKIYNHKVFYEKVPTAGEYGLDNTCFLLCENSFLKQSIQVNDVPFYLNLHDFDNVQCEKQAVDMATNFRKVHYLGFFYWGENFESIKLLSKDGKILEHKICYPDWTKIVQGAPTEIQKEYGYSNLKPGFTLTSAGKEKRPLKFFHYTVDLGKEYEIEKAILPDNFFLHIFAITAERTVGVCKEITS